MCFSWSCLRYSSYLLVVVVAVLFYFHLECVKERDELQKEKDILVVEFKPDETDVVNYMMGYARPGAGYEGRYNFIMTVMPCFVKKMLLFVCGEDRSSTKNNDYSVGYKDEHGNSIDKIEMLINSNITIHDARKKSFGGFHQSGFTLVHLEEELNITDWTTPAMFENAEIHRFHQVIEPHIKKLYPDVKRMQWMFNLVRGNGGALDHPRVPDSLHSDYHQNFTERVKFHKETPLESCAEPCVEKILMGQEDKEDEEFKILLGLWKPIGPAEVCDFPLALIDASTFHPEDEVIYKVHFDLGFAKINQLSGMVSHSPNHRWAYYPFQSTREVLIFHGYSKDRFFANPHTSFHNKNCPKGTDKRASVEMKLALYF